MVLIMLGPPGVGKGTQGEMLAEEFGFERLATGDVLREARKKKTPLGKKAQEYMDRGDLVPDDLIVAMVRERLAALGTREGVILDGFPRTVPQAESLGDVLRELDRSVNGVLLLTAPDDVLVKRISGRRSCPECGRLYNVHFDPPEVEGRCDQCGAELLHRDDDDPETVRHRLDVYSDRTEPLVDYYRSADAPLIVVDGDQSMEAVSDDLVSGIRDRLQDPAGA